MRALLALFVFAVGVGRAQVGSARAIRIAEFAARIQVGSDAVLHVEERLKVRFDGHWNGIHRDILTRYTTAGARGSIRVRIDSVEGDVEWFRRRRFARGTRLKIKVRDAVNATREIVLRYDVENALRSYDGIDELYWNVTGTGWPFPIDRASATVVLPDGVALSETSTVGYAGALRSTDTARVRIERDRFPIRFRTTGLAPHHGLTVAVGFPQGYVTMPTSVRRAVWFLLDNWAMFVAIAVGVLWFLVWWVHGRDPMHGATILAEYEPPPGLRPAEVGLVADDRVDPRDITATILDLAVRGRLKIREEDGGEDFRLRAMPGWRDHDRPYERALMDAMFAENEDVSLADCRASLSRVRPEVIDDLHQRVVAEGLFHADPGHARSRGSFLAVLTSVGLVLLGLWTQAPMQYWIAAVLAAGCALLCGKHMPQRTKKGLEALRRVRGMEEYMHTAERQRMKSLPMDVFERLLPYAVALGMHKRWLDAFKGVFTAPQWMEGTSPMGIPIFLDSFVGHTQSALYYAPRSEGAAGSFGSGGWSGGSGFGGGGVGGGFGGGGGGGW